MTTVCVLYATIGTFGYWHFGKRLRDGILLLVVKTETFMDCVVAIAGSDTDGDILTNYSNTSDNLMNVAKALMVLHVVLAYPVVLFPGITRCAHDA